MGGSAPGDDLTRDASAPAGSLGLSAPTFSARQLIAERFLIVRFIAHGGMGEVYEAEDRTLRVRIALKTIRKEVAADPGAMERFRREMLLARKVTHPNICRLFDLFVHRMPDGRDVEFLTMELLEGRTLADELAGKGPLTDEKALPIVRQIASALDAAHEAGVIHRDFKTANVMLVGDASTSAPRAVVTDFGLARSRVAAPGDQSLTGAFVGTPAYMAPEQVLGEESTASTDIYALGLVLFEMLTGTRPFRADTPLAAATKRLSEKPESLRAFAPTISPRWEQAILKCLEREPQNRYKTAGELVGALSAPDSARRPRSTRIAVAAVLTAAAIVAGFFLKSRLDLQSNGIDRSAPVRSRTAVAVLGFKNLSGREETAWISTALAEMLTTELATGGELRTVPGETVARVKKDLGLVDLGSMARDTLARIRASADTDAVVIGTYVALPSGQIRLDFTLQGTAAGDTLSSGAETGTESDLFSLVVRAGGVLRRSLGVAELHAAESRAIQTTLGKSPDAQRLYAEGVEKLRAYDAVAARELLERAIAADPGFSLAHSALADAWARSGYLVKAREEAKVAFELSKDLPRENRLSVEAKYRAAMQDRTKALELAQALFAFFPDNIDYGLQLVAAQIAVQRANDAFATVDALRKIPRGGDARIDLAEADVATSVEDSKRKLAAAQRAIASATALGSPLHVAQARQLEGSALLDLGQTEQARSAYYQARDAFLAAGERGRAGLTLNSLGNLERETGDFAKAREAFEQALIIFRERGARRVEGMAVGNLALVDADEGNLSQAASGYQLALRIAREVDDRAAVARHLNNLAVVLWERADLKGAAAVFAEARAEAQAARNKITEAAIDIGLADVLVDEGRLVEALDLYERALATARQLGSQRFAAFALAGKANVMFFQGQLAAARATHEEALKIRTDVRDSAGAAESRLALAVLSIESGSVSDAETLARQAADEFATERRRFARVEAEAVVISALAAQGRFGDAADLASNASADATRSQNPRVRVGLQLSRARLAFARRDLSGAAQITNGAAVEAKRSSIIPLDLRSSLLAAQIEAARNKARGVQELDRVAREAARMGFTVIARRAEQAAK